MENPLQMADKIVSLKNKTYQINYIFLYLYYRLIVLVECSLMVREIWDQSQDASDFKNGTWYLLV